MMRKFEDASQRYAYVIGIERDPECFMLKLQEEVVEVMQARTY